MTIGIYDPYLDDLGGGEKYMMTIAECLAKNHEVSVFWDDNNNFEQVKKRFSLDLEKVKLRKNIFSPKISFRERVLETKKYDVLIILSDGSIPFVLSKKLFIHLQQPLKLKRRLSLKERVKLFRVKAFFCNSNYTASFHKERLTKKKIRIIYPPVDLAEKNIAKENIVLHVGRFRVGNVGIANYKQSFSTNKQSFSTNKQSFTLYKKQEIMIKVFKEMVDQGKIRGWKFIIAVSVHQKDEEKFFQLKKMAEGYPIEFFVNKTNDELRELYGKAKIYWHASGYGEDLEKNPEYAEHFGISTVEAMGAGAVPVVINAGGQREIVEDGKNGFLWNSLEELISKTNQLMNDEELWEKMSVTAKDKARVYSKENFCQAIEELVEK